MNSIAARATWAEVQPKPLFNELRMDRLREQALADVDEEWRAKRLRRQNVDGIIEPFPKRGELDKYVEGMDNDGGPL